MKNKLIVAVASVALNLLLFAALLHATKVNNLYNPTPPAFIHIEHMPSWIAPN
jgi:hypothetical protein